MAVAEQEHEQTTSVSAIVADFERRGVVLRVDGDSIDYDAPRGVLTIADLGILLEYKSDLIDYLVEQASQAEAAPSVEVMSPSVEPTAPDGIVVETPDRPRMLAAVIELPEGPGDADESGLEDHPRWLGPGDPSIFRDGRENGLGSLEPIDFAAADCPAWAFDESLAVRSCDVRSSIAEVATMNECLRSRGK